jgi:hypothetical protein
VKFEGLLREIGEPAPEHVLPPPPEGPPDMERLLPIAARWAYDILGPPGSTPRALASQRFTHELCGVAIDQPGGAIYTFRSGKIIQGMSFLSRGDALEAAGLSE